MMGVILLKYLVVILVMLEIISLMGCIPIVKGSANEAESTAITSPLSAMNGKNYENPVTVGPVVILEKKKREIVISGDVKFQTDLMALPAKFVKLQLTKSEKTLQEIQTDVEGHFSFRGSFQEGDYFIKVKSNMQEPGFKVSVVNSDVVDLVLLINKK